MGLAELVSLSSGLLLFLLTCGVWLGVWIAWQTSTAYRRDLDAESVGLTSPDPQIRPPLPSQGGPPQSPSLRRRRRRGRAGGGKETLVQFPEEVEWPS